MHSFLLFGVTLLHAPSVLSAPLGNSVLDKRQTVNYAYLNQPCGAAANARAFPGTGDNKKSGLCCSSWNRAGVTDEHCFLSNGCQPAWGRCVDSAALPPAPVIYTGCSTPGVVSLGYDDGPSVLTSSLLDYLKNINVKVTFYVNGIDWKAVQTGNPLPGLYALADVVKRAFAEGHQICSHTWSHTDFLTVNQWNTTYEISRLNNAFNTILNGTIPTCIRPPYGDYDAYSLRVLQGMGYGEDNGGAIVLWNLDAVDWDPAGYGTTTTDQVQGMMDSIKQDTKNKLAKTGFVTLNHDVWNTTADFRNPGGSMLPTVKPFTQQFVEYMKSQKWRFVRLDECLGKPINSMYRKANPSDLYCGDSGSYGGGSCFK